MQARMEHPAMVVPGAMKALTALSASAEKAGLARELLELVHLRASQINGCSVCVEMHARYLRKAGETDERLFSVAAWRDAPYFTDAERVALELTEVVTRVADRPDPVSDDLWSETVKHFDQRQLAALLLAISSINVWNRLNAATRQVAGTAGV
ncbi:MAG TPA: carboxymuconolactone decarboxylase family protein [Actinophytocola sp.]|uniref:carboxymuconolactone decarboxylase family protein n=1 Tax=Actinophytocola sp. TaxID=1872138 RepID=UPI002DDD849D|nr:carboxymuconolactone decarboxylase family protein [Actinophytocola sp.]HEV2782548.1 carboxymuconolactone decarboxylase family protein [Actinophytocola sp.]